LSTSRTSRIRRCVYFSYKSSMNCDKGVGNKHYDI